jgi:hypothetical protein
MAIPWPTVVECMLVVGLIVSGWGCEASQPFHKTTTVFEAIFIDFDILTDLYPFSYRFGRRVFVARSTRTTTRKLFKREQAHGWGQLSAEKSCPVLPRVLDLPKRANHSIII